MEHFFKRILLTALVAVGAFSGEADALCAGTVRFKPPVDWTEAYFGTRNCSAVLAGHAPTLDADGYFTFDLGNIGYQEMGATNFSILSSVTQGNIFAISRTGWVTAVGAGEAPQNALTNNANFPCPGAGNTVYIQDDPLSPGTTYIGENPPLAKYLYVLVPDDKDWQSDNMMVSTDGGVTGTKMENAPGMCGWYRMVWEETPDEVLIYPQNHPDQIIGVDGLWGGGSNPTPLPLKTILEAYGSDRLYFIPDDSQWYEGGEGQMGLFVTDPGVDGICKFELAAVIYDSDESVNPLFSSDPNEAGYGACTGVRHGIVKEDLGPDNKPQFNAGNSNATTCAGNENLFRTLFNYTKDTNEVQCYDMPFRHYGNDPRWGFDSDSIHRNLAGDEIASGGYTGGFFPLEKSTAATRVTSISPVACDKCRTKRKAEAPVPNTYSGDFDKYCNTPGWFAGVDCDRLTSPTHSFYNGDNPAVWDWGTRQDWSGVTRNQQFCFESHATFTYQEDQEFTFRGDDDIWVFINKKLAIDNGGAHLSAPGRVVLKNLNVTYGAGFLIPGNDYPLDIFFCDRRAIMSNVMIKTNIFIKQTSGLSTKATKNSDGSESYSICYDQSGDGSCAGVAGVALGSSSGGIHACGSDIRQYGTLRYRITTRAGDEVAALTSGQSGWQYGGIDLSDPFNPKVNKNKIKGLAPGSYRLVIELCNMNGNCDGRARTYINFRVTGNLDVMTQSSTYVVYAGDEKSPFYASGTKWTYANKGLSGSRVPIYVSAFADGGVDLLSAIGQTYTLNLAAGMVAYTSQTGDTQVTWPKTINETGVDTIWVSLGLDGMTANPEVKAVSLKTRAEITFSAPRLDFAEPLTVDSDGRVTSWRHPLAMDPDFLDGDEYFHWVGSDVGLYVVIVNPITGEICTDCQMAPILADASADVTMGDVVSLGNGAYAITVRSSREYMNTTAYITISAPGDVRGISLSSYANMRFRRTPGPYPQLVDLFDARGGTLGPLYIPEPYYSESKHYLDGRADSIAIYYSRPFQPNALGSYADSLPYLICLDWDEDVFESYDFFKEGVSSMPGDTSVHCSYIFTEEDIVAAHEVRVSDSILTFAVRDTAFSKSVKTAGNGKILSYMQYKDKGRNVKQHFDRNITDRIAPVIVSATIVNFSDQLSKLTVTLSEPVKLLDEANKMAPFTFYMNSANEMYTVASRYTSPTANVAPGGTGTNSLVMVYDKTQPIENPTPRLGDYIRFRADSWMWSDTADIAVDGIERVANDYYWHWNSPTDYNSTSRHPSPWVQIRLDDSYSSSSQSSHSTSSASTQSSSSVKRSSSSKNAEGGECTLTDKGDGRIIQKCGDQETVLYKALCGTEPYDPEGDFFCYGVKLYEKCDGEAYDVNTQKCVDGAVTDLGSGSSDKDESQAIRTAPQVSWSVQTSGRTIHILEAELGSPYALIDMQGRVLNRGVVSNKNFAIPVGLGGQYMLKIGNQTQVVRVW